MAAFSVTTDNNFNGNGEHDYSGKDYHGEKEYEHKKYCNNNDGALPKKTILCTFGIVRRNYQGGPQEGLCDIIFWDYFYNSGRGTFLNRSSAGWQWFLEFARNDSGATQFGIGIDHGNVLKAYNDLNDVTGISTFNDLWDMNIRHYGLLKLQVHDAFVTKRSTFQDYYTLFKKLRDLQEVSRARDVRKYGCIILGVGLLAPRRGEVYDYLEELLR
ncbi:uncharacterized protein LOC115316183 [Ixodes scapularis]|uniref:uncharacterized protein LOC115316183 n=1 Tax=Ixodes scapularis TaxID=6945 RepID=UPI001C389428|nr:uncharacterized protein LOC115316183 [Ixodes scapularis]